MGARGGGRGLSILIARGIRTFFVCCAVMLAGSFLSSPTSLPSAPQGSSDRTSVAEYEAIDIGPLLRSGAADAAPRINASGEISYWQAMADQTIHAFTCKGGRTQDLGTLEGFASSATTRANARGQKIGWSISSKNLLDSGATTHAFLYSQDKMVDLRTLGGRDSKAMDVDASGQAVGMSSLPDGSVHGFLYREGKLEDLGTLPGGTYSAAYAINSNGLIAGAAETATHLVHAVIWNNRRRLIDLGTLRGGLRSRALGLNDRGNIVGFSEAGGDETHAFLYANGRMQDLGSLGNDPVRADAINNRGQIVGASGVSAFTRHAYIWENGRMQDLNSLISTDRTQYLQEAYDINDEGQIVCVRKRTVASRDWHLVLLNPLKRGHAPSPQN